MKTRQIERFGWLPDLPDHRDKLYEPAQSFAFAGLPASVDLRPKCPPVVDQGQLGSCTANAIAGAFQFDRIKQGAPDFPPSRLFIYYNERAIEGTVKQDSGAYIRDGIKSVAQLGVCAEANWPYTISKFKTKPTAACYTEALKYQALTYSRIIHDLTLMKTCLASGLPFVFGITVYDSFPMTNDGKGDIPLPKKTEGVLGGHAMMIVGYDDATQKFIVRNSWGTGWGNKGYGTIPYAYLTNPSLGDDFWVINSVE